MVHTRGSTNGQTIVWNWCSGAIYNPVCYQPARPIVQSTYNGVICSCAALLRSHLFLLIYITSATASANSVTP